MEGPQERPWRGRRVSPFYYVQDGVVPPTQIAPTLGVIAAVGRKYGLTISNIFNIFHPGDGNLHPIILFDAPRFSITVSEWAGRSPASTASAWRRTK